MYDQADVFNQLKSFSVCFFNQDIESTEKALKEFLEESSTEYLDNMAGVFDVFWHFQ